MEARARRARRSSFFNANGFVLVLWGREKVAEDNGVVDAGGWGGVGLAYNVGSTAEVDTMIEEARAAGASIPREPCRAVVGRLLRSLPRSGRSSLGGRVQPRHAAGLRRIADRGRLTGTESSRSRHGAVAHHTLRCLSWRRRRRTARRATATPWGAAHRRAADAAATRPARSGSRRSCSCSRRRRESGSCASPTRRAARLGVARDAAAPRSRAAARSARGAPGSR